MTTNSLAGTGLEVVDLATDPDFNRRQLHHHDAVNQLDGIRRLARAMVGNPESLLQELVETAIDLCGADSAGISLQTIEGKDTTYNWVATAGKYAHFLNAKLPAFPSACAVCIERNRPQIFRASKTFFDLMNVEAEVATDGVLIPWEVDGHKGTIWIIAHGRSEAFDLSDCRIMETLADFAAIAVRQQRQQKALLRQASVTAAASMANHLAHQINNPLQSLTNCLFLAESNAGPDARQHLAAMAGDLDRLSSLTAKLLALPSAELPPAHPAAPPRS